MLRSSRQSLWWSFQCSQLLLLLLFQHSLLQHQPLISSELFRTPLLTNRVETLNPLLKRGNEPASCPCRYCRETLNVITWYGSSLLTASSIDSNGRFTLGLHPAVPSLPLSHFLLYEEIMIANNSAFAIAQMCTPTNEADRHQW